MKLPDVFSRHRAVIDAQLRAALGGDRLPLYDILRYHMGWLNEEFEPTEANSGKAVRPALCLFACDAAGGDWQQALPAATSLELIHNFSLVHDDIQDGDTERRHRPTVWYRWGMSHGLNAGDAMNVLANLALFQQGEGSAAVSASTTLKVSRILTRACAEMIEGQTLDLSYEQRPSVSTDDYLLMISKKTGALLESALHIGAVIGTEDEETIEGVRRFGRGVGRLFQVRDDMLGVWGKEEVTGKLAASDLRRRKKSLPVIHALEHSRESESGQRFSAIYGTKDDLSDKDIEDLLGIMEELDTYRFCQGLAEESAGQTVEELEGLAVPAGVREECEEIVAFLLEREA